jgi:uncharacterized protein YjbI with pentapeptide repeats
LRIEAEALRRAAPRLASIAPRDIVDPYTPRGGGHHSHEIALGGRSLRPGVAVANEEHVERLKKGVANWNAWCKDYRGDLDLSRLALPHANLTGIDLTGADMSRSDLSGADLTDANLSDADLSAARLSRATLNHAQLILADLSGADLTSAELADARLGGANLYRAKLNHADLHDANLAGSVLKEADLTGTILSDANLSATDLTDANLTEATLHGTVFGETNLSAVIGLDTCEHLGPSPIDFGTLQKSGQLPLPFLRGLGLPDHLIEYLSSRINLAIAYHSCFISYSSRDQDFADRLHADLQDNGVRCWFAPHDLPIGGKILDEIDTAIRLRDKVLLILSEHSIKSGWVEDEVSKAFAEERERGQTVLFPVRLDDAVMDTSEAWAVKLRDQRNIGDFRRWKDHDGYQRSFERVLRDLKLSTEPGK